MGKASRHKRRELRRRSEEDPIAVLHDELSFCSRDEAMSFVAGVSRNSERGNLTLAFCDSDHRLVDMVVVADGGTGVRETVEILCGVVTIDATGLLLISDRTGELPADRPDDELLWIELVQIAKNQNITLYDWFVTWGLKAFSVAEFAPLPAQWAA